MILVEVTTKSSAIVEILIMLIGAAVFGYVLAWLIYKNKQGVKTSTVVDNTKVEELTKLNQEYLIEIESLKSKNHDLLADLENCKSTITQVPINSKGRMEETIKQDLKVVEGIGPKIEELLNQNGIYSFTQLAHSSVEVLKEILLEAGPRFHMHEPASWPKQALLAANNDWEALKRLQEELVAGRA